MKSTFLILLFFITQLANGYAQDRQAVNRPNIIFIMCDDLGWGDVGFNGNAEVKTPNLDRLARQGITFNRFYSAGAVCSPTRASCLTGRHPDRMGIVTANAGHLKPQEITLPELLKEAGYSTGHFGKWHLGTLTTAIKDANRGRPRDYSHYSLPTANGYDTYLATESKVPTYDPMIVPTTFDTAQGESLRYGWAAIEKIADERAITSYGTYYWEGTEEMKLQNVSGDDSRVIMDRVIPFVRDALDAHQPFFTTIWFHTPHLPVVATKKYRDLYPDLSYQQQLLYGSITSMDEQVGRLWSTLEELGIADNTLLWFCSDNGPEVRTPGSAGPFRGKKRDLYEGGVRVPAFCIWPEQLAGGKKIDAPLFTGDYLPTTLAILEKAYTDDRPLDGLDIWPILSGERPRRDKPIGFMFKEKRSWVTERYKLISTDGGKTFSLYNLIQDPAETIDLAIREPERTAVMKATLLQWIASVEASKREEDY